MKDVFLSIDLDYWMHDNDDYDSKKFFNSLYSKTNVKKITIVRSHEEMTKIVNETDCNRIWNIDAHSDLFNFYPTKKNLLFSKNCANWANFINIQKRIKGEYCWFAPLTRFAGACHGSDKCPFTEENNTRWKSLAVYEEHQIHNIDLKEIKEISICISPGYVEFKNVKSISRKLGIPDFWFFLNEKDTDDCQVSYGTLIKNLN